jgi:hypothetical protein
MGAELRASHLPGRYTTPPAQNWSLVTDIHETVPFRIKYL